jgi:uncharacterized membrane protein YccC
MSATPTGPPCPSGSSPNRRGLILERAAFRILGTLLGAAAGFALLRLTGDPYALLALLGLWVAANAALTQLLRGVHGYGTLMAGMTAAVVILPSVLRPEHAAELAMSRVECTLIGVVTVTLVTGFWTPDAPRRAFYARLQTLAQDVLDFAASLLRGSSPEESAERERRILRDLAEVQSEAGLVSAGSVEGYRRLRHVDALAVAAIGVMATAQALGQERHRGPRSQALAAALAGLARSPGAAIPPSAAEEPRLAEPLGRFLRARAAFAEEPGAADARSFGRKAILISPQADLLLAVEAGLLAGSATSLAALLGLVSGWPQAELAALGVCIISMILGSLPSARKAAPVIATGVAAGVLVALAYRFLLQPHVTTMPGLILSVLPFILVGGLARASSRIAGPALDANMCFMLASQAVLPAVTNHAVILNEAAALMLAAGLVTTAGYLLPSRAPRRAARAARAAGETLQAMACRPVAPGPATRRASRQLLRLGLQIGRALGPTAGTVASPLAAYSLGDAILGLHTLREDPALAPEAREALSSALAALGGLRTDPLGVATRLEALAPAAAAGEGILRDAAAALRACRGLLAPRGPQPRLTSSRAPSPRKIVPATPCSQRAARPERASRADALAAPAISTAKTGTATSGSTGPSISICTHSGARPGATNCGRNARKNSATFGLVRLVSIPCSTTRRAGTPAGSTAGAPIQAARSACTPSQTR